jgi:hypothetical protein
MMKCTKEQALKLAELAQRYKDPTLVEGLEIVPASELRDGHYIQVYAAGMMIGVEIDGYAHT